MFGNSGKKIQITASWLFFYKFYQARSNNKHGRAIRLNFSSVVSTYLKKEKYFSCDQNIIWTLLFPKRALNTMVTVAKSEIKI
jgi:hypothetical protein